MPTPIKEEIKEEDFGDQTGKHYDTAVKSKTDKSKTEKTISEGYSNDTFEDA